MCAFLNFFFFFLYQDGLTADPFFPAMLQLTQLFFGITNENHCNLFQTEIDIITNKDEWNSWPGYVLVSVRMCIMIWFIVELRRTSQRSQHPDRLDFFQQFGAYYLVWFTYLPILVLIATQISFLWRYKTILSKLCTFLPLFFHPAFYCNHLTLQR